METILDVSWLSVVVASIAAFMIGWGWYSDTMFGKKWRQGIGTPSVPNRPMMPVMITQFVGTFLLTWAIIVASSFSLYFVVLIAIAVAVLIKANGLFVGKSNYAVAVDSSYIIVQTVIVLVIQAILT